MSIINWHFAPDPSIDKSSAETPQSNCSNKSWMGRMKRGGGVGGGGVKRCDIILNTYVCIHVPQFIILSAVFRQFPAKCQVLEWKLYEVRVFRVSNWRFLHLTIRSDRNDSLKLNFSKHIVICETKTIRIKEQTIFFTCNNTKILDIDSKYHARFISEMFPRFSGNLSWRWRSVSVSFSNPPDEVHEMWRKRCFLMF